MKDFIFPNKVTDSVPSIIREVMDEGAKNPNFISFAMGNPAKEAIPTDVILDSIREITNENPMQILQYGPQMGYAPLMDWTHKHMIAKGFNADNKVLMLAGSGAGLGLMPRCFCNEGDEVFVDEFTFVNGINAVISAGAKVVSIKMDQDGMIPADLEEKAKAKKGKYIYLIPNFHNPLGMTMSLKRRKELYEIAQKYDLLIYEDDPYGDIRFKGEPVPAIKTFDVDDRVVYAGSYSKVLSAGLRVGYLYVSPKFFGPMLSTKTSMDGQGPILNQMIVHKSLEKLDFAKYIAGMCDIYGRKCKIMVDALHKYCGDKISFVEPDGGMFVWIDLPANVDSDKVYKECLSRGVGIVKSIGFAADYKTNPGNSFRLNYTFATDEQIEAGVKILGEVLA